MSGRMTGWDGKGGRTADPDISRGRSNQEDCSGKKEDKQSDPGYHALSSQRHVSKHVNSYIVNIIIVGI